MGTGEELAAIMDGVARRLHEPVALDGVLRRILQSAVETIPGAVHAGLSVWGRGGRIETLAWTDVIVTDLDTVQYEFREGPCVDAMQGLGPCSVEDMSAETRWPNYAPKAVSLGVRSQLGVELRSGEEVIGGLSLYAEAAHSFNKATPIIANLFATHAAHAMGKAMKEEQLTEAIASRTIIGQAMGIVMERYGLDDDRAFSFLKRTSQDSNTKLVEVARHVVDEVNRGALRASHQRQ
ncbi:MAG: GAF and ANTAR domain-containing protein [Propionibacteriaceae bacterium]